MEQHEKKEVGIVMFLGFIPLIVIRKKTRFDAKHILSVHKTYWLFGFIPLFSTDSE